jgi:hypothetical protein
MVGFCIYFFYFYWLASILLYVRTQSRWFSQFAYFIVEFSVTLNLCRSLFNIFRFIMFLCKEEILRSALCYNGRVCARRIKSGGISFYLLFLFLIFALILLYVRVHLHYFSQSAHHFKFVLARVNFWCDFVSICFRVFRKLVMHVNGSSWLIMQQSTFECATITTVDVVIVRLRRWQSSSSQLNVPNERYFEA